MKRITEKHGFTLMEMLIVVAIIAILIVIMIPVGNGAVTAAREVSDVKLLNQAVATWEILFLDGHTHVSDAATADDLLALCGENYSLYYPERIPANGYIAPTTDETGYLEYIPTEINGGRPYTWELTFASED